MIDTRRYRSNDRNVRSETTNGDVVDVGGGRNLWADNASWLGRVVSGEVEGE